MFIMFRFVGSTWERAASKNFLQIQYKKNANVISIDIPTIAILKFLPFPWEGNFQCI
jgi:hypothetical protein